MIYIALIITNVLPLFFLKSKHRFWFIGVALWVLVIITFIGWHYYIGEKYKSAEIAYNKTIKTDSNGIGYGDFAIWQKIEEIKNEAAHHGEIFIALICLQSIITCLSQVAGYLITKKKVYNWTSALFIAIAILTVIFAFLSAMSQIGGVLG